MKTVPCPHGNTKENHSAIGASCFTVPIVAVIRRTEASLGNCGVLEHLSYLVVTTNLAARVNSWQFLKGKQNYQMNSDE